MVVFFLQKYVKRGKILMPFAFSPMIGNCFLKCLLNESSQNMADIFHAVDNSFAFLRKSDGYGKLFSIVPHISEWFPEMSGYNACRKSSLALYNFSKVRKSLTSCWISFDFQKLLFFAENRWWTNSNVWRKPRTSFHWHVYYEDAKLWGKVRWKVLFWL